MTSNERHEARYQRRKAKRQLKRDELSRKCGNFNHVFSYQVLYEQGLKCKLNVNWKASTQAYISSLTAHTWVTHSRLMNGTWKSKGFHCFKTIERGKTRDIKSVHIRERVVQKALCDEILVPVFSSAFIYDNSATLKHRGCDYALDRINCHLEKYYRHYGSEGYVLLFDFSNYFGSAPHNIVFNEINRRIVDKRIRKIAKQLIEDFGDKGFGLGSQVSQISGLMTLNSLDHFIKEKLRIKYYGRYMDDGYLIHHSKKYLQECLEKIIKLCSDIGVTLNIKKTKIVPLSHMRFLKTRFILTRTGKVVRRMNPYSSYKMREKLRKFREWVNYGKFSYDDVLTAFNSYRGHMKRGNSYRVIKRMTKFVKRLFPELAPFIRKAYE